MWKLDKGTLKLFMVVLFFLLCGFGAAGIYGVVVLHMSMDWLGIYMISAVAVATGIVKGIIECMKIVQDMIPDCESCPALKYAQEHGYKEIKTLESV